MSLMIEGNTVDDIIMPPTISDKWRSRSVEYTLDGTALEDRLGGTKKSIRLPFGVISQSRWELIKTALTKKNITVAGNIGGIAINSIFRLADDEVPTPVLYVENNEYMCQPFTVTIEEV